MKIKSIFFFFMCLIQWVSGQDLLQKMEGNIDFFRLDNLGNLFMVQQQDIKKYDVYGKLEARNSNKFSGKITELDGSNALKILVFNKELSQLAIFDNKLSERGMPLSLEQFGFEQVIAVASSYNNGIWLWDQLLFELIRLDQNLEVNLRSGNLIGILKKTIFPENIKEYGKWLYVNDPNEGIFVFDIFATYYKTLPIKKVEAFQLLGEKLIYLKEGLLFEYDMLSLADKPFLPNLTEIDYFAIHKEKIYIQKKDQLFVYKF